MSKGAIVLLSAAPADYSEILEQINARVLSLADIARGMSDMTELAVGILAGIVCFLGILFGFKFISFLFEQIRR